MKKKQPTKAEFMEVKKLLVSHCDRMIAISEAQLKHSGSEIGAYLNKFSIKVWKREKSFIQKEVKYQPPKGKESSMASKKQAIAKHKAKAKKKAKAKTKKKNK